MQILITMPDLSSIYDTYSKGIWFLKKTINSLKKEQGEQG